MDKKSDKVAELTIQAEHFLKKGDHAGAETCYKQALVEGMRLLGLRHALTRNVMSLYSDLLRADQRDDEAIRYEALYWRTARLESYRLAMLFESIRSDVVEFLEKNADSIDEWGQQMTLEARQHSWNWNWEWAKDLAEASKEYLRNLRYYVWN